ncbi:MAG TPA: ketose-bisphosphate aldolase, partial [Chromatiaceae bacterium]|nr:ketose-bisphosphate aldolase [Chromatiaceae bacterium]
MVKMPIVDMKDMLQHAYENRYAVGAFDLVSLDFLQGIIAAAEKEKSPVILSLAESHFDYFDFELLMSATLVAAKRATVPVAIHLDHGSSIDVAIEAIRYGCNGIMIDSSDRSLEENISITQSIVTMCKGCGVPVEGELGYVPGVEGEDAERHPGDVQYTMVDDAIQYVEKTNVDFLAVAIGTVHGRMKGKPNLDFERLHQINEALGIPLVIHGGTGLDDNQYKELIKNGVAKINYYTALSDKAANMIYKNSKTSDTYGYTGLVENVQDAIAREASYCINLWGSANRSDDVMSFCKPWKEVEHLIIYNVDGINETETKKMINEGKKVLSS